MFNREILAPGIDKTAPDLEARALRQGMNVASTRDAIMSITGGKTDIKASELPTILRATAALISAQRATEQAKNQSRTNDAAQVKTFDAITNINTITAADINRMNAAYYGRK